MFYKDTLTKEYQILLKIESKLSDDWKFVGEGRCRKAYKRRGLVLKIPFCNEGVKANKDEYYLYRNFKDRNYAPCRLVEDNCLIMLAVDPIDDCDPCQQGLIPQWAWNLLDGPQIGFRNSKLLVYDYADEIETI